LLPDDAVDPSPGLRMRVAPPRWGMKQSGMLQPPDRCKTTLQIRKLLSLFLDPDPQIVKRYFSLFT